MNLSEENLLNVGAGAFLTLLERKKAQAVDRLVLKFRAGEALEGTASEITVYTDLINNFKQRLVLQQAGKGVPNE